MLVPTRSAWICAWHVVAACTAPDVDLDFSAATWSKTIGDHETLAGTVPWATHAAVYFYRGHFEPWQLARQRHDDNLHIKQYADNEVASLDVKGFKLVDGTLYYLTQKKIAGRIFPAAVHIAVDELPSALVSSIIRKYNDTQREKQKAISMAEPTFFSSSSSSVANLLAHGAEDPRDPNDPNSQVWIALSARPRQKPYHAALEHVKPEFAREYLRRIAVGKKGLVDTNTWIECLPQKGCKTAIDLINKFYK